MAKLFCTFFYLMKLFSNNSFYIAIKIVTLRFYFI